MNTHAKSTKLLLTTTMVIASLSAFAEQHKTNTLDRARTTRPPGGLEVTPASELNKTHLLTKASEFIGRTVVNLQDEKLGTVQDLIVDLPRGQIVHVILSVGGFLGIGDELCVVPPSVLTRHSQGDTLRLDANKEQLTSAPRFNSSTWPNFNDPKYVNEVYRSYKVDPYYGPDGVPTVDADNTKKNERDRTADTLTPLDQGNNETDLTLTRRIRLQIMEHPGLSTTARNVKVITTGGRVTLRGPVNTAEEKTLIAQIAGTVAKVDNVDDQLEVKQAVNK